MEHIPSHAANFTISESYQQILIWCTKLYEFIPLPHNSTSVLIWGRKKKKNSSRLKTLKSVFIENINTHVHPWKEMVFWHDVIKNFTCIENVMTVVNLGLLSNLLSRMSLNNPFSEIKWQVYCSHLIHWGDLNE